MKMKKKMFIYFLFATKYLITKPKFHYMNKSKKERKRELAIQLKKEIAYISK